MILNDGTDTDKVMIRAVNKNDGRVDIGPLSIYAQSSVPKTSLTQMLEF